MLVFPLGTLAEGVSSSPATTPPPGIQPASLPQTTASGEKAMSIPSLPETTSPPNIPSAVLDIQKKIKVTKIFNNTNDNKYALNDKGQIVAGSLIWENEKITTIPSLVKDLDVTSQDINENGQVVGEALVTSDKDSFGLMHAFFYENGVTKDIGKLLGSHLGSSAKAINNSGQVVGYYYPPKGGRSFLWDKKGGMKDLGILQKKYNYVEARDINDNGQIVGGTGNEDETRGFIWESGVMKDLGTLGGSWVNVLAINNKGQVVGYAETLRKTKDGVNIVAPFIWENDVMKEIQTPAGGIALDINDRGQVLGEMGVIPFVWQKGGIMYLRDTVSLEDKEAVNMNVSSINNVGQIAGSDFLLTLPSNTPPKFEFLSQKKGSSIIRWRDSDSDNNANISLYYFRADRTSETDEQLIVSGIQEDKDGKKDSYLWDTSDLEPGTYFMYAQIDDGVNPTVRAYSQPIHF